MKRYFFLGLFLLLGSSLQAQNHIIEIHGSTTLFPLLNELSSLYMDQHKGITVNVRGGGSGLGLSDLDKSRADLAMSSRSLNEREKEEMPTIQQQVVAYDALSIIVHPSNPVRQLSMAQLKGIFSGKIKNWSEVGGRNETIRIYNRDKESGTYGFMLENVLDGEPFAGNASETGSNSGVVQQVSQDRSGIGYIGLAYAEDIVRTLAIENGTYGYVKPTFKSAMDRKYPIIRPLSLYYLPSKSLKVKPFLDFTMSPIGQKLAAYEGYIPAK